MSHIIIHNLGICDQAHIVELGTLSLAYERSTISSQSMKFFYSLCTECNSCLNKILTGSPTFFRFLRGVVTLLHHCGHPRDDYGQIPAPRHRLHHSLAGGLQLLLEPPHLHPNNETFLQSNGGPLQEDIPWSMLLLLSEERGWCGWAVGHPFYFK